VLARPPHYSREYIYTRELVVPGEIRKFVIKSLSKNEEIWIG
jgi:hypothetical protein